MENARYLGSCRIAVPRGGGKDPLLQDYVVSETVLGSGADGGVKRGTSRATGHWRALKYLSRQGHFPIIIISRGSYPHPKCWWIVNSKLMAL